jgi:hypothetical protein
LTGHVTGDFYIAIANKHLAKINDSFPEAIRRLYVTYIAMNIHFPPGLSHYYNKLIIITSSSLLVIHHYYKLINILSS